MKRQVKEEDEERGADEEVDEETRRGGADEGRHKL